VTSSWSFICQLFCQRL